MQKLIITALILSSLSACAYSATRVVVGIVYDRDVDAHLKLASDANNIDLSEQQLSIALSNLEDRGTFRHAEVDCFTSVLYNTPDEDVCFWLTNLTGARDSLVDMREGGPADPLIESNQLIKVRETLLDHSSKGDEVTAPAGISVYPHNNIYSAWGWLSLLMLCGAGTAFYVREVL